MGDYQYRCVTDIFLENENKKILMIHRSKNKEVLPNFYNGLGGKVKPGETIYKAILREVKEESGIDEVNDMKIKGSLSVEDKFGIWHIFIFTGKIKKNSVKKYDTPEGKLEWIPRKSLKRVKLVPDLYDWIDLLWKNIHFFFAKINYDQEYNLKQKVALKIIS